MLEHTSKISRPKIKYGSQRKRGHLSFNDRENGLIMVRIT